MTAIAPLGTPLLGDIVRLDPALESDAAELYRALNDPQIYTSGYLGGPTGQPQGRQDWQRILRLAINEPGRICYTVRLRADSPLGPANTIIGTTSFLELIPEHGTVEVGATAYAPAVWASSVNPECKLLLLTHLFQDCHFGRVRIQTDAINQRSQRAIEKLGAVKEGVLRRHRVRADGSFRDTVVYSILDTEWPSVRAGLLDRLGS